MITEAQRIRQEQIEENALRYKFQYTSSEIVRAIKFIARAYPNLRTKDLQDLHQLKRLADNLLIGPDKINAIPNFTLKFGVDFEANILVNGIPYDDYLEIQSQKFQEVLDLHVETFARSESIKRPGFVPEDFDNITGWTSMDTMTVKNSVDQKVAAMQGINVDELSFNLVAETVRSNPDQFSEEERQALRIYQHVIAPVLSDIITSSLEQMLEDILIVAGSNLYSNVAITLGNQLNLDNRKALETTETAERRVLATVKTKMLDWGAIFPQLKE